MQGCTKCHFSELSRNFLAGNVCEHQVSDFVAVAEGMQQVSKREAVQGLRELQDLFPLKTQTPQTDTTDTDTNINTNTNNNKNTNTQVRLLAPHGAC